MVVQTLTKHGIPAKTAGVDDPGGMSEGESADVRMVCLSYLEPLSTLHLRFAVRLTRRRFPGVRTVLGIWRQRDPGMGLTLRQAARADVLVTTVYATLSAALEAAGVHGQRAAPSVAPDRSLSQLAAARA